MTRRCASCDGSMAGKRRNALYCSRTCREREKRRRHPRPVDRAKLARFIEWKAATGRRTGRALVTHKPVHRLHKPDLGTCVTPLVSLTPQRDLCTGRRAH